MVQSNIKYAVVIWTYLRRTNRMKEDVKIQKLDYWSIKPIKVINAGPSITSQK